MTKAEFEKVTYSEQKLFGPRKLLLCGFHPDAQPKFMRLLEILEFSDLPVVWIHTEQGQDKVGDAICLPNGAGFGHTSELPRTLIVSGVTEKELHRLMGGCRQAGMKQALWAVLTPTSEKWRIIDLLKELEAERNAMSRK